VDDSGTLAYSADGISWTAIADSGFGDRAIVAVTYGNGRFVAVGVNQTMAYADW
jgi:hypothetical protein